MNYKYTNILGPNHFEAFFVYTIILNVVVEKDLRYRVSRFEKTFFDLS